jgi:hypothetical protein
MTERLTETDLMRLIPSMEFPPLKFKNLVMEYALGRGLRIDCIADIEWETKSYKFIIEAKRQATPEVFNRAVYQIKDYLSAFQDFDNSQTYYPMLIAPYLSEAQLERLAAENISGLDLCGNGLVIVPGELFVYRFGAKNKFPANAPIKNVFRGVSSIVPRVFLAKLQYAGVTEVLDEITARSGKITLATVSKVLKTLEEELIISRKGGIRLLDGRSLLKKLSENYRRPKRERIVTGKAPGFSEIIKIAGSTANNGLLCVLDDPQRYAVIPSSGTPTRIYTEDLAKSLQKIEFYETNRFPNLEIIETQDPTIYFDRRYDSQSGLYYTPPVQVYLDLANGGKREQEIAEQLRENILKGGAL